MGIIVGLISATLNASQSAFLKALSGLNPNVLTFVRYVSAAPILALIVTILGAWTIPPIPFWLTLLALVPLEIGLAYVATKALHLSPLSIVAPLTAYTSLFLIPVGYVVLGELPSFVGLGGVLLILLGSLLLGWKRGETPLFGLSHLVRDRGAQLALFGAFLASITVSVIKLTFDYAEPLLSAFYVISTTTVVLVPSLLFQQHTAIDFKKSKLAGLGAVSGLGFAVHYIGLSLLPAVYFISIKRLSMVISVLFGGTFFREEHIVERLIGATLMVLGVVFIALG